MSKADFVDHKGKTYMFGKTVGQRFTWFELPKPANDNFLPPEPVELVKAA